MRRISLTSAWTPVRVPTASRIVAGVIGPPVLIVSSKSVAFNHPRGSIAYTFTLAARGIKRISVAEMISFPLC